MRTAAEEMRYEAEHLLHLGKSDRYKGTNFTANVPNIVRAICQRYSPDRWQEIYPYDLFGETP